MPNKLSQEEFIERCKALHSDRTKYLEYDYSKAKYINNNTKFEIICPVHGSFWQLPGVHNDKKHPSGCPKCRGTHKRSLDEFVEDARKVHGNKYDYSEVKYVNNLTKVKIICPKHGIFYQDPVHHIAMGQGCPKCGVEFQTRNQTFTWGEVLKKFKEVHGNKYDYSEAEQYYIDGKSKVKIICPIHGEFWQSVGMHRSGQGCPECGKIKRNRSLMTSESEFIKKAREIHGNKYDYSDLHYEKLTTKAQIICPKHGPFWQKPTNHLEGRGCPKCQNSLGETAIRVWLENHNIKYEQQKYIKGMQRNGRGYMKIDFYLPDYGVAIEYNGQQHYKLSGHFRFGNTPEILKDQQERDRVKKEFLELSDIVFIEIPYTEYNNIGNILSEYLL